MAICIRAFEADSNEELAARVAAWERGMLECGWRVEKMTPIPKPKVQEGTQYQLYLLLPYTLSQVNEPHE